VIRYAPNVPFPAYAFRPGRAPHPRRDPTGHSFGQAEPKPPYMPPDRWRHNEAYLFGVDLYNHDFWWESHELWEALWHPARDHEGQFLQGLIQIAAANIQRALGNEPVRLATAAIGRLQSVPDPFMGLRVRDHIDGARAYHLDRTAPAPPLIRLAP
jgi:hypothetical protein